VALAPQEGQAVESGEAEGIGRKLVNGPSICTFIRKEDDRLGAVGGAAGSCGPFLLKKTCWEPRAEQPAAASAIIESIACQPEAARCSAHRSWLVVFRKKLPAARRSAPCSQQVFFSCS